MVYKCCLGLAPWRRHFVWEPQALCSAFYLLVTGTRAIWHEDSSLSKIFTAKQVLPQAGFYLLPGLWHCPPIPTALAYLGQDLPGFLGCWAPVYSQAASGSL